MAYRSCFRLWHRRKSSHPPIQPCYGLDGGGWDSPVHRRAAGVTLSRKGAKSRTGGGRKPRSAGAKARTRAASTSQAQLALVKKLKAYADDVEKKLEARTRELAGARENLAESLEQQTATSELLGVISSSPGKLETVFRAMLENAVRICEAKFGVLYLSEGDAFRVA